MSFEDDEEFSRQGRFFEWISLTTVNAKSYQDIKVLQPRATEEAEGREFMGPRQDMASGGNVVNRGKS